ncbi:hypothetical protein [Pararcticibacter amylolyticus]|uniref:Uncharacterized protein n=1 Tax=Pararcticibacter amylolyticus TaxID=2173175 RepID=A0A2U2PL45_9SPHI|nr:hypothetical protein [Pararcticibacter amylolyticus]PWG82127.1 hypothetical protein DDR33_03675 [Pararcticibacter amylolyticus]
MATRDKFGNLRGSAGNMVYRMVGSKNIAQAKPGNFRQTEATQKCSKELGLASTTAKAIRKAMDSIYDSPDGGMNNRLTRAVKQAIAACTYKDILKRDLHNGDLSFLKGFQFNINSPIDKILKINPAVTLENGGQVNVCIPAFHGKRHLVYPKNKGRIYVRLRITLTAFNLKEEYYIHLEQKETDIQSGDNNEINWQFSPLIPEGCFLLVCISLMAFTEELVNGRKNINGKDWSPAAILEAFHFEEGNTDAESAQGLQKDFLHGYMGNILLQEFTEL